MLADGPARKTKRKAAPKKAAPPKASPKKPTSKAVTKLAAKRASSKETPARSSSPKATPLPTSRKRAKGSKRPPLQATPFINRTMLGKRLDYQQENAVAIDAFDELMRRRYRHLEEVQPDAPDEEWLDRTSREGAGVPSKLYNYGLRGLEDKPKRRGKQEWYPTRRRNT